MPEEDEAGCGGSAAELIFEDTQRLEKVEVTGRAWDDGWVTVCREAECAGIMIEEIPQRREDASFSISEAIVEASGVRDKKEELCRSVAAHGPNEEIASLVRNTTNELNSDVGLRESAAAAAWNVSIQRMEIMRDFASMSPTIWLDKYGYAKDQGYTVTFTYSDGGTEEYKFKIYSGNGDLHRKDGTLKPGSGQSKCPK